MALSGRAGFWQEALDPRFHGDDEGGGIFVIPLK